MELADQYAAALELAERLDISVRQAAVGGEGGGLCTIKGRRILFIDTTSDLATRADIVFSEIAQLSEIDTVQMLPELREVLASYRRDG